MDLHLSVPRLCLRVPQGGAVSSVSHQAGISRGAAVSPPAVWWHGVCRRGEGGVFSVSAGGALHLELALGTRRPAQLQDTVVHPACHRKPKEVISEEISI